MVKIFYNENGWVCERFPNDIKIEDRNRFIEVSKEEHQKTMGTRRHFAWRVIDGKLREEQFEDIPTENLEKELRALREEICFPVINRGTLWNDLLTEKQKNELRKWYACWLNVTETKEVPKKPDWLKMQVGEENE